MIRFVCNCMGIHAKTESVRPKEAEQPQSHRLKIYVSNHVTCLDYFSIKSVINQCKCVNIHQSNRILDDASAQNSCLETYVCEFFRETNPELKNKADYPLVCFPELMTTNGKQGLLKFDTKPFDLEINDSQLVYQPVCLRVTRPYFPLSVNSFNSTNFTNILLTLFSPVTVYELTILGEQTKTTDETSEQLAERIRTLISNELKLTVFTDMNFANFQLVWRNFQAESKQSQAPASGASSQQDYSMSFSDISRLALQIKEILPDVSYEVIQSHIRLSSTLDIDTVIASILDASSIDTISLDARPVSVQTSQPTSSLLSTSSAKERNLKNSFSTYEERKFYLINEARKRYLDKNKI